MLKFLFSLLVLLSLEVIAADVYLAPEKFLQNHFPTGVPKASKVWMKGELSEGFKKIMSRRGPRLMKYWKNDKKTVWILGEIGKTQPITTGYVVEDSKITQVRILIYRETHGYEVRHPSYTSQFEGATLIEMAKLDRQINGIAGATLSHRALIRMAQLALFMDSQVGRK